MAYVDLVSSAKDDELAPGEHYLGACRFSMPKPPRLADVPLKGLSMNQLRQLTRVSLLTKGEPQAIPGFPTAWEMAIGLTPQRLVVWRAQRGTDLPANLLGAVAAAELEALEMTTVPDRRGRTLAVKFTLRNGPRVLLDVVTGYRADAEAMVAGFRTPLR